MELSGNEFSLKTHIQYSGALQLPTTTRTDRIE